MISTASKTLVPSGTWTVDPAHTSVGFAVKHLGIATVRGKFEQFEGTLEIGESLESARAYGTVQAASVNTNDAGRDEHLRSADFFGADANPELRFESKAIVPLDEDTFEIEGDLTMNGVTNPVKLTAVVEGTETDPWGNDRVGLEVTGRINRGDWNMNFNQALGSGNLLVGEKVTLTLDISAVKKGQG
jgi:polyisoprenoid-binding protein YceI